MFPVVSVSGPALIRGRQYGRQARDRIHRSIEAYADTYRYYAGWGWRQATDDAQRYLPAIEAFSPSAVEELTGIAEGAGVDLGDVLAINVRTEVLYSNRVSNALAAVPAECSVFASSSPARVVAGQNWDWAPFALDTCVVLESRPDDGPAFTTIVEAGLLAKFGVNSDGFALMTNALSCTEDVADAAVPYHVMLRGLIGCSSTDEALDLLSSTTRASSANYVLVDCDGGAVDVEARPGGPDKLHRLESDRRGVLLHTNHFTAKDFDAVDYTDLVATTTRTRLDRLRALVDSAGDPHDLDVYESTMADHANEPDTICRHPDRSLPAPEQSMTVSSVLVDLRSRTLSVSAGPPCGHDYERVPWPTSG
jgi:isopenicillin-N N-acyltransferase like protein